MAAYIDEYRNRFKVGPICRVLSESLGCGFLAPRGYRMVESRPVSRMRVVPEFLRTLVFARPRGDDQFADCTFSPSLDMSR